MFVSVGEQAQKQVHIPVGRERRKGKRGAMPRKLFLFAAALSLTLVLVCAAGAQTASMNGTVTDPSGALVQHAKVTATNTATNTARSTETGSAGVYSIAELVPAPYNVTIEKAGLRTVKFAALTLTVDQAVTLNAKLAVGSTQEQVTVVGAALPVDTTDAQLSNVVEHRQMTELPLILRQPYQLVLLSPGVTQSDSSLDGVSVNGGRERNNNLLLDGADNNYTDVPGSLGGITSQNPDSIEEFRIITNNFAPEYGRNNGAIIDVITRSGTNDFHGDVFYFGRWDALGARDFFDHYTNPVTGTGVVPKNLYIRNLYGASLGGPIIKDKTFFFLNYQGDRFITTLTNNSTVPTKAFKTGIFTYTNPSTGASQPLNVTTAGSGNNATGVALDPVMQKILAFYREPTIASGDGVTGKLFFPSESREKVEDATLKIDHKLTRNNSFSARYIYNWFSDPNSFHTDFLPGGLGAIYSSRRSQGLALSLTSTPSATLVNELRASANRTHLPYGCTGTGTFDSLGYIDPEGRGADYALPTFSGPYGTNGFGCQAIGDLDQEDTRSGTYQYKDTLTKVLGKHTTKFGAEVRRVYSNNFYDFFSRADFTFNAYSGTGYRVVLLKNLNPNVDNYLIEDMTSMLLGVVNTQSQTQFFTKGGLRRANDELDFRQREYAIFAQDEWKALPNLTLTYGLRWEYYAVPFETNGNLSNLFEDASGPPLPLPGGGTGFTFTPVGPGTGHQLYQPYYRNFEPRVGFAWDPFKNGKTSIRGGIGAFSDRVFGNLINNMRGNPPFEPSVYNYIAYYSGATPAAQLQYQTPPAQLTPSPVVAEGSGIYTELFANNIKPPSVVTWNFGIQQQLTSRLTMEVNYVGNHGTRILRAVSGNPPQPGLVKNLVKYCSIANAYGCTNYTLQGSNLWLGAEYGYLPYDAVNNSALYFAPTDQTSGHSWYDGLQAQVTERPWHGLQIQLSYTWSHALDDSSDPLAATANNGNYPVDSLALNREHGNSGFDTRQRAVMNFIYQPNIGRGKSFLGQGVVGRVLEGWQISGIASFQTGLPYDIFGPLDTLHTGVPDRATVIDSSVLKTVPTTGKYFNGGVFTGFNPAAFNLEDGVSAPIPWGIPANVVRNQWYGPGVNRWDVSLSKATALTERVEFQLRLETYNLFNRVQFAKPYNYTAYAGSYFGYSFSQVGQIDGTTGARQIQIAGKLTF